ncbi:MAG TPA: hypothetical protein G4O13_00955 [Dehalococcoidia bacterium]|nr:hypothetical protein [Dehalococcoidia bacterium]
MAVPGLGMEPICRVADGGEGVNKGLAGERHGTPWPNCDGYCYIALLW